MLLFTTTRLNDKNYYINDNQEQGEIRDITGAPPPDNQVVRKKESKKEVSYVEGFEKQGCCPRRVISEFQPTTIGEARRETEPQSQRAAEPAQRKRFPSLTNDQAEFRETETPFRASGEKRPGTI